MSTHQKASAPAPLRSCSVDSAGPRGRAPLYFNLSGRIIVLVTNRGHGPSKDGQSLDSLLIGLEGPGSCEHVFVECNHQLGLGAAGPGLGGRKRTVGSFSPPICLSLDHFLNVLCLALALDPVGTATVTGREPHLHLYQHPAQQLQEGRP